MGLASYRARKLLEVPGEPSEAVRKARGDFLSFVEYVTGLPPANHHHEWAKQWQTGESSGVLKEIAGQNTRIAAPRDSAKTTYSTTLIAWVIGLNPNVRIIVTSYNLEIAQAISVYAKNLVESPKYREVFPWIRRSHKWAERQWLVRRDVFLKDPTVLAVGMSGGLASRRADLVLIDDPIKSSMDIANKEVRLGMRTWFSEVLAPCVVPGGRILVACTRYRVDDIHGTTFTEDNGWKVITQQAIVEDEEGKLYSYWPERYSLESLLKKKEENPAAFASQYQNSPLPVGTAVIRPEWISKLPRSNQFRFLVLGIDPAISKKETADYSALVLVGLTRQGKFQTISQTRGRWTLRELLVKVFGVCDDWEDYPLRIVIETVAYQAAIAQELKRQILLEDRDIRVKEIKPKGDKESRLYGVTGLMEAGDHSFVDGGRFGDLIEELLNFGSLEHDDLADAWVYALTECLRYREFESSGL
jgi:predicted phage terminase large subunit-like protein